MLNSRMLYKYPGTHKIQGIGFDYIIVPESEVEIHLKKGWAKTPDEAKKPGTAPPIKMELPARKRNFNDLTDDEKSKIKRSKSTIKKLAEKYNLTTYAVKKVKANGMDKETIR